MKMKPKVEVMDLKMTEEAADSKEDDPEKEVKKSLDEKILHAVCRVIL